MRDRFIANNLRMYVCLYVWCMHACMRARVRVCARMIMYVCMYVCQSYVHIRINWWNLLYIPLTYEHIDRSIRDIYAVSSAACTSYALTRSGTASLQPMCYDNPYTKSSGCIIILIVSNNRDDYIYYTTHLYTYKYEKNIKYKNKII